MSPVFSPDGSRIAYTTVDASNEYDTWVVPVLGGEPRRWLPNASGLIWTGRQKLLFSEKIRGSEGNHMKIVAADESRADERDLYVPHSVIDNLGLTPDGQWLAVYARPTNERAGGTILLPLAGGTPVPVFGRSTRMRWSRDGRLLFITVSERTYAVPVPRGQPLPRTPPTGFASEADIAALPGARVIDAADPAPGPTPDVYAFSRETVQRNLYRIPFAAR